VQADNGLTPLKLREVHDELPEMIQQRKDDCRNKWRGKAIHGKFAAELSREYVDQTKSHEWLKKSGIFPETLYLQSKIKWYQLETTDESFWKKTYKTNVADVDQKVKLFNISWMAVPN